VRLQASGGRGRPRADRAAARRSRLRLRRSCGHPDPHQRAALRRPATAAITRPDGSREALRRDLPSISSRPSGQPSSTVPNHSMAFPEPRGHRTHVGDRTRHVLMAVVGGASREPLLAPVDADLDRRPQAPLGG
jgi:hypothetical protein